MGGAEKLIFNFVIISRILFMALAYTGLLFDVKIVRNLNHFLIDSFIRCEV